MKDFDHGHDLVVVFRYKCNSNNYKCPKMLVVAIYLKDKSKWAPFYQNSVFIPLC